MALLVQKGVVGAAAAVHRGEALEAVGVGLGERAAGLLAGGQVVQEDLRLGAGAHVLVCRARGLVRGGGGAGGRPLPLPPGPEPGHLPSRGADKGSPLGTRATGARPPPRPPAGQTGCGLSAPGPWQAAEPRRPQPDPSPTSPPPTLTLRRSCPRGVGEPRADSTGHQTPEPPAATALTADELPPAPQQHAPGGAGAGVGRQGGAHAVLVVLAVARVVSAPLGGKGGAVSPHVCARTPGTPQHTCKHTRTHTHTCYTCVQVLHVPIRAHTLTCWMCLCTHVHTPACAVHMCAHLHMLYTCVCVCARAHTQQLPAGASGSAGHTGQPAWAGPGRQGVHVRVPPTL